MEKTESIEEARAFLMSVEELAALLHKSPATVRSDVHRRPMGLPPRYKLPGMKRIFYKRCEVMEWLDSHIQKES